MLQLRCISFCAPELFARPTEQELMYLVIVLFSTERLNTNMTVLNAVHVSLGQKYFVIVACLAVDPFSFNTFLFAIVAQRQASDCSLS